MRRCIHTSGVAFAVPFADPEEEVSNFVRADTLSIINSADSTQVPPCQKCALWRIPSL